MGGRVPATLQPTRPVAGHQCPTPQATKTAQALDAFPGHQCPTPSQITKMTQTRWGGYFLSSRRTKKLNTTCVRTSYQSGFRWVLTGTSTITDAVQLNVPYSWRRRRGRCSVRPCPVCVRPAQKWSITRGLKQYVARARPLIYATASGRFMEWMMHSILFLIFVSSSFITSSIFFVDPAMALHCAVTVPIRLRLASISRIPWVTDSGSTPSSFSALALFNFGDLTCSLFESELYSSCRESCVTSCSKVISLPSCYCSELWITSKSYSAGTIRSPYLNSAMCVFFS